MVDIEEKTSDPVAKELMEIAKEKGLDTLWDRLDKQSPQCGFGDTGLCCRICLQGPCRINPHGGEPNKGVCGARDYTIVARNLIRMAAAGCAAHSDHGRHIAHALHAVGEGHAPAYGIKDVEKLIRVAGEVGIDTDGKDPLELARLVVEKGFDDFSRQTNEACNWFKKMMPDSMIELADSHNVLPTNIDRGICEVMHRTTMGCDADPVPLIFGGLKAALGDLTGENFSTEVSDILFGTPKLIESVANLGSLKEDHINICVHGHNPVLSEIICDMAEDMKSEAEAAGAKGFNIVGICCTANELLMRRGIPIATNYMIQELAIATGVIDSMVVDYQCIAPSQGWWSQCFHTQMISTQEITRIPGDMHIEFHEEHAEECARDILNVSIDAFKNRDPSIVHIPKVKNKVVAGFSLEEVERIFSLMNPVGPYDYIAEKINDGTIKGIALLAGCNNAKVKHDFAHNTVAIELAKKNVLVLATGCAAQSYAKHGLLTPEAAEKYAGDSLKGFLKEVGERAGIEGGLPLIIHMGSCVDNSRVQNLVSKLAQKMNLKISELPIVGSAPEAMSEKAVAIGSWLVTTGWPTHVGVNAYHKGSPIVTEIAEVTAHDVYGGFFVFEQDPIEAARKLNNIIKYRRWRLEIGDDSEGIYWDGTTREDERPKLTQEQIFNKGIDGAVIATGYAEYLLNRAITRFGRNARIEYPGTGYYLPCVMAWYGVRVETLGQLPIILGKVRGKINEDERTLETAIASGEATMIAAEIVEAIKYIDGKDPYEDHPNYSGFVSDVVLRELGIGFVDDTIPGAIVLVGKAKDSQALKKVVRDAQNKGMLIIATFDIIQQIKEAGIQVGDKKGLDRMLFCVGEFTQAIHGLSFAIRAAMVFGGKEPGDRKGIYEYMAKRPKVVVIQLGPLDDIKIAAEFAVLFHGSPTITDQDIEEIPGKYVMQKDYDQIISTAIEIRDMVIKMGDVDVPVAYGPAFEGETVRRGGMAIEAGGASKTLCFELCKMREADQVEDGKIQLIGTDLDEMEEGASTTLGMFVEVYGKKMQEDFEPVLERRIHQFINFAEGGWHTGQRNLVWIRLSKASVKEGFCFKHFGTILYTMMHQEFGAIVNRVQVTIITDPVELEKWKEEAWRSYEERDLKMADLTDEAVDTFYTCSLCQSFAPDHICIISPERLGLCGAVNWMDCKASKEIAPTGPNQPVPKTGVIDERIGQWEGVNQAVREYSHGKIEIFNQYSLMKYPMTSCGCFECIVAMTADAQGFIVVNREYGGMTPIGMKFTTLAGSVGGGKQTPGFLGIGRKFLVSPKFIRAEDGFKRLMWMPKQLKEDMRELMEKRAKELGIPNFLDKIADETNVTDPAQLMEWCIEVGHPAMALPNLMEFM
jgi:acetyl-CoA synthase